MRCPASAGKVSTGLHGVLPGARARYLAEIADSRPRPPRDDRRRRPRSPAAASTSRTTAELLDAGSPAADSVRALHAATDAELAADVRASARGLARHRSSEYAGDELVYTVRGQEFRTELTRETLSGTRIPRVALPRTTDHGELVRFLRAENLPGRYPFTAGVFPFKREGEAPARMFAGEGDAFRTNRRFKLLSERQRAPPACRRPSTRSRSTAATPTRAPTSTARSARPGSRSPRSTT